MIRLLAAASLLLAGCGPAPAPERDLAGTWSGTWTNRLPDQHSGRLTLDLKQDGNTLSGTMTIEGTPCLDGGAVSGTLDGAVTISGTVQGKATLSYQGTVAGESMSGTYESPECGPASGDWTADRTADGAAKAFAGPRPGRDDLATIQMRLIAAAERIRPSMAGTSGFAGVTIESELNQLRIYWKGELPRRVRAAIDAEWPETDVAVFEARHSEQELLAARPAILAEDMVTGAGPLPDGSGLLVSVRDDESAARGLPAIQQSGVPIQIVAFEEPVPAIGRQADTSPYSGGSSYTIPGGMCTTGFAVEVANVRKILSAGHCAANGDIAYEGNGSGPQVAMGQISGDDDGYDTLLIDAASIGDVYLGPHTSVTSKPVLTEISNWPKTLVCTSGAVTGEHCPMRIVAVNQAIKYQDGNGNLVTVYGLVRAEQQSKTVAAGTGDSGGPVLAMDSVPTGITNVYPLGTITAIDPNGAYAPCGPALSPNTLCSWKLWYADVNAALIRYQATMVK